MQKKKIYLLAGLGFDYRIFDNLELENCGINFIHWLEPEPNESLKVYVKRMSLQIGETEMPLILIGHSFGGIIVQEVSRLIKVQKVIIISSIKSLNEMPITLRFLKHFPLHKLFNQRLILRTFQIWARAFGYNSEKGRALFIQMISNCTDNYFKWSMDKIVNWQGNENCKNVVHIHGTSDKTFFIKNITNPIVIPDGSHFMVFSKSEEVTEILNKIIWNN